MPKISCLIPTYNTDEYLAEAIQSLLNQTYKDFEIIVQDDGSTDTTEDLMDYFTKKDKRVKYFKNPKNLGIAKTRNNAFKHSKGEYIVVCDADDVYHPGRLKMSLKAIKDADIVYSPMLESDANGRVLGMTEVPVKLTLEHLRQDQTVPHPTIMAKRKCFEEHPYREEFTCNDDLILIFDWWLAGYTWKKIKMPVTIHRHYNQSVSIRKRAEVDKFSQKARKIFEEGLK